MSVLAPSYCTGNLAWLSLTRELPFWLYSASWYLVNLYRPWAVNLLGFRDRLLWTFSAVHDKCYLYNAWYGLFGEVYFIFLLSYFILLFIVNFLNEAVKLCFFLFISSLYLSIYSHHQYYHCWRSLQSVINVSLMFRLVTSLQLTIPLSSNMQFWAALIVWRKRRKFMGTVICSLYYRVKHKSLKNVAIALPLLDDKAVNFTIFF